MPPSPTILIADKFESSGVAALRELGCTIVNQPDAGAAGPAALAAAVAAAKPAILVVRSSKTPREAIAAGATNLKGIIRAGAGYDNIDVAAATQLGVSVCNCPGMNATAVAELVFALLLALDRHVVDGTIDLRAGKWNKKTYSAARGLKGLTLGIVGVGSIGREVIGRAKAFGMRCRAHSLNMNRDRAADLGIEYGGSSREELLAMLGGCDAVTLHVAANPESERMCDREFFDALKKGAYFINTSRGSVVDEEALAHAITSKGIRAGLDVYANEPPGGTAAWKSPLADLPGVIGTHHIGASTDQAQAAVADEVVRIVKVYRDTGRFENRVS